MGSLSTDKVVFKREGVPIMHASGPSRINCVQDVRRWCGEGGCKNTLENIAKEVPST